MTRDVQFDKLQRKSNKRPPKRCNIKNRKISGRYPPLPPKSKCYKKLKTNQTKQRNAFFIFLNEYRKNHPDCKQCEVATNAGKLWSSMSDTNKYAYKNLARRHDYMFVSKNKDLNYVLNGLRCAVTKGNLTNNNPSIQYLVLVSNYLEEWKKDIKLD